MKTKQTVCGFLAVIFALAFSALSLTGCPPDPPPPDPVPGAEHWINKSDLSSTAKLDFSVASDGVCTITVSGTPEPNVPGNYKRHKASVGYRYAANKNTTYEYVIEAWTAEGERTINVQSYYDSTDGEYLLREFNINTARTTYILVSFTPKGGERYLEFQCADKLGTFYVKVLTINETTKNINSPEYWSASHWNKWSDQSTTTLSYEVDKYGVCIITVTGTPANNRWNSAATFQYITMANTSYTYVFEAWTESGTRELTFQYYGNNDDQVWMDHNLTINHQRQTYTIKGGNIPKNGERQLAFQCADQLGIFYLKILSIEPYEPGEDEDDENVPGSGPVGGGGNKEPPTEDEEDTPPTSQG